MTSIELRLDWNKLVLMEDYTQLVAENRTYSKIITRDFIDYPQNSDVIILNDDIEINLGGPCWDEEGIGRFYLVTGQFYNHSTGIRYADPLYDTEDNLLTTTNIPLTESLLTEWGFAQVT